MPTLWLLEFLCMINAVFSCLNQHSNAHILFPFAPPLSRLPIQTIKITQSNKISTPLSSSTIKSFFTNQESHRSPHHTHHSLLTSYNPPTSKEEAILQAKTCLSATLVTLCWEVQEAEAAQIRVEFDDSNDSLTQLAFQFFQDLVPSKRKGTPINTLILWPNQTLTDLVEEIFSKSNSSNPVRNLSISSIATNDYTRILNSADVAVFLAPETSQLEVMRTVSEVLYPKPVVVFNPKWGFEEENGFGELNGFVGSFEVVYSFMGLEVRGLLSKRNAVVFKCVKDGVLSGEQWVVLVEEGGGDMKVPSVHALRANSRFVLPDIFVLSIFFCGSATLCF